MTSTTNELATSAYIAYQKEKGFPPENATHLLNWSKRHKPPFIGLTYRSAKQIISEPPNINTNDENTDVCANVTDANNDENEQINEVETIATVEQISSVDASIILNDVELLTYQQLISMGFEDKTSWKTAKLYKGNLNKCIDHLNNKKHINNPNENYDEKHQENETKSTETNPPETNSVFDNNCASATECESIKRIIKILMFCNDSNEKHASDVTNYISDSNYVHFVNDYQHILTKHTATNYEEINDLMTENIKCNVSNCVFYERNERAPRGRNQHDDDTVKIFDKYEIFYADIMDNIHTFFVHGYDMAYRTKIDFDNIDLDNDSNSYCDKQLTKLKSEIDNKRKEIVRLRGEDRMNNNKFVTNMQFDQNNDVTKTIDTVDNKTEKKDDECDDNNEEINTNETLSFCFGQRYYYWDRFKNLNKIDPFNPGYKYSDWYISKKYQTFKQEIINELDITEYNEALNKATILLQQSNSLKSKKSIHLYNIETCMPLQCPHLMSVIFYTDYSSLCFKFSATFRKQSTNESNESMKKRNSMFWNWSKLLHETIQCWGTVFNENCGIDKIKRLYHGVSQMYITTFLARFCSPTSMTKQLAVSAMFAGHDGIILEFRQHVAQYRHQPYYFNCTLISRFAAEDERLFAGGKGFNGALLQFSSIRNIKTEENYSAFVKALTLFDTILNGQPLKEMWWLLEDELIEVAVHIEFCADIISKLYNVIQSKCISDKLPVYIVKTFEMFINKKSTITIDIKHLKQCYPNFHESIVPFSPKCSNLLQFDYICNVFKECKTIVCNMRYEFEWGKNASTTHWVKYSCISVKFMSQLLYMLAQIDKNKSTKLQTIRLQNIEYDSYCYNYINFSFCLNMFKKRDWNWTVKEEKVHKYRTDLIIYRDIARIDC
eukprot:462985_1